MIKRKTTRFMTMKRWLSMALVLVLLLLTGCGGAAEEPVVTPEPTPPADGNPSDITCQGSYTVDDGVAASRDDDLVATVNGRMLTNGQLQIYYWMEVAAYKAANHEVAPDFTQPLDVQMCDIDDTAITWQQYFLQCALDTWYGRQALAVWGAETPLELEAAYQPNAQQHEEYLSEDLPALKYLYGYYNDYYEPNSMHQDYLDQLPELLNQLAKGNGFVSLEEQLLDMAGAGADAEALEAYAYLYNWCYMYYTQLTYDMELAREEVEAYFLEHEELYAEQGITKDGEKTVSIRHVLVVPEGTETAEDGSVTVSEADWETCRKTAENLLAKWKKETKITYMRSDNAREAEFGELAYAESADAGTASNGGLLSGLTKGKLTAALDEWAFAEEREYEDMEIIRTDLGYHIVFYCGSEDVWYTHAEADLLGQMTEELMLSSMAKYPVSVDYDAICLGVAAQTGEMITDDDVLYDDIAHERFPTAPVYLQRDYPTTMYGAYPVHTYGCGITTMAMLASYYTDEEWTVPELCAMYGQYCFKTGSDYSLYDNVPCELGFYGIRRATKGWDEVSEALENGQASVSLQRGGYWTRRGHYILLQNYTEDGLVVVRDSNILNYGSIENHKIDAHEVKSITAQGILYWICEEKVVRTGSCSRCDDTDHRDAAMDMLTEDYFCSRCCTAMTRRDNFVNALNEVS